MSATSVESDKHSDQESPVRYAPVRTLMLALTDSCNLDCHYCFVAHTPRRMSSETARKAVDFFVNRSISGGICDINLTFFGGEPFLELDRMEEVIAYASTPRPGARKRINFAATTNGTVASPRVERIIRDSRMSLFVSMDGDSHASAHRPFKSGRPSHDLVARNLPLLSKWSPEAMVRLTFHPRSLDLVGNVAHVLELGGRAVALAPVLDDNWEDHVEAIEEAYQALAGWYIEVARAGFLLPLIFTHQLLRQYHATRVGAARPKRSCGVGTSLLGIDPDGNVMPCHRFLYRPQDWLGTVDRPKLSPERQKYVHISSADMPDCSGCVAESVCGGGCRLVSLSKGHGLLDTYTSHCITMRAHARAVHRIYETLTGENNRRFLASLTAPGMVSASITELLHR